MPELTDAQIAALPEEWQKMAHDTTRIRQAVGLVYDPFHEIRLCDQEDLLAALADATLRAEQTALQPGQVAVDEANLRDLIECGNTPGKRCSTCSLFGICANQPDMRDRVAEHFGLEVEK